jgi:Asp-tRNA(Asn)/Glu-tRNA(Gln) amidotransferase A subunit family amidase
MCHAALGTQTAGSISRPASYCGVAGFKPSYGRIAGDGVFPFSPDADHVGPIAGDVEGLHSLATVLIPDQSPSDDLTAVARPAERLALSRRSRKAGGTAADLDAGVAGGLTVKRALGAVLIPDDEYLAQADASGAEALRAAAERLHSLGVTVQRVRVFEDLAALNEMHFDMIAADFAEVHAPLIDRYGELYRRPSLELAERGAGVSSRRRESARAGRAALRDELDRTLDIHGAGLWISPAAVGEAPHGLDSTGSPVMNIPWTYAGVPTVAVPATRLGGGVGPRRLPLGVQAAGRFNADESLLSLAALVELVLS